MQFSGKFLFEAIQKIVTLFILIFLNTHAQANTCQQLFDVRFNKMAITERIDALLDIPSKDALSFIENNGQMREINFLQNKLGQDSIQRISMNGSQNYGIYRIGTGNLVLKIHKFTENISMNFTVETAAFFLKRLHGNLIGQLTNGPIVKEYGIIKDVINGRKYFFTIMEDVHPNEARVALKEVLSTSKNNYVRARAFIKNSFKMNPYAVLKLAKDILFKLEMGVLANDPDISISISGKVKWIDTDMWTLRPHNQYYSKFQILIISVIVDRLYQVDLSLTLNLVSQLKVLVNNSEKLTSSEKMVYVDYLTNSEKNILAKINANN